MRLEHGGEAGHQLRFAARERRQMDDTADFRQRISGLAHHRVVAGILEQPGQRVGDAERIAGEQQLLRERILGGGRRRQWRLDE